MTMPRRFPETTIERDSGRLFAGASSPTSGNMIWGVTVVMDVIKLMPRKTLKFLVIQRAILCMSVWYGFHRNEGHAYHIVAVKKIRISV